MGGKLISYFFRWRAKWKEWALSQRDSWVDNSSKCGILYMWSYPAHEDPEQAMEASVGLYHLVHALHEVDAIKYASVWVVTQGALVESACPSGALSVGTVRTVANELQEFCVYSVDLERGVSAQKHVSQLFDVITGIPSPSPSLPPPPLPQFRNILIS